MKVSNFFIIGTVLASHVDYGIGATLAGTLEVNVIIS